MTVFVSHAAEDQEIVNHVVDLLQLGMGIQHDEIFCSSIRGMGTPNGEVFVKNILEKFNDSHLILAVLSPVYFRSLFCVGEVGAGQLRCQVQKTAAFYSLLVPPANYDNHLKGTLYGVQSGKITDTSALDELRDQIIAKAGRGPSTAIWNKKRDEFLAKVGPLIRKREADNLLARLIVQEAYFSLSQDEKIVYKLKLFIVIRNRTGQAIVVEKPEWNPGTHGAQIQVPHAISKLQLCADRKWDDGALRISVPAGDMFRLWVGLDLSWLTRDPPKALRVMRNGSRLGVLSLQVTILDNQCVWKKQI